MLHFDDSYILITVAMLLALLLALFVYFKDSRFKESSLISRLLLISFRFISLSILILFLFNPKWINNIKSVEKPILVFLQDASSSILNYEDSLYYKTEFENVLKKNNTVLKENYDVYEFHFQDSIYQGFTSNFSGKYTNISNALQSIEDQFHNRNLAAVVVASDGNYTQGLEPNYRVNRLNVPVYTLALGDSTAQLDQAINAVNYNEIAYLGNEFPVAFELQSNFSSLEKEKLEITHKGKLVYEEWLNLEANTPIAKEILIEANAEGIQYYDLSISSFKGEKNKQNNKFRLSIEILNNTQNILILASAPHPDISALKSALETGKNYRVETALAHEFKGELEAYNLIILHQLPEKGARNKDLISRVMQSNTSVLFVAGKNTKWNAFNEMQDLIAVKTNNSQQSTLPVLNNNFAPFNLSDQASVFINTAPPLISPFGEFEKKEISHTLFTQNIEGIKTNKPLFIFAEKDTKILSILLAEGLWKWHLFDFQKNKTHDNFNEIIQSVSQYLTLNKDKRKLRLKYPKLSIQGDVFKLNAQLYNDNYQLIENAELNLVLVNDLGNEYLYNLTNKNANYSSLLTNLSVGNYTFTLQANYKKEHLEQKGTFAILPSTVEQQRLEANWELLQKMSDLTKGRFIVKDEFANYSEIIRTEIEAKPKIYFSKQLSDLIQQKAIFFVLLLSLFFEWALRKYLGTH